MERSFTNILKNGEVGLGAKTLDFGCFFISSTEWIEKADFGQLMITLSNETENPITQLQLHS